MNNDNGNNNINNDNNSNKNVEGVAQEEARDTCSCDLFFIHSASSKAQMSLVKNSM